MARKFGESTINRFARKDFRWMHETFEETISRWAETAAKQLRDSFAMQRIYNGSDSSINEVWNRNGWGWNDENARRKSMKSGSSADYWFSDGQSYRKSNVTVENLMSHKEANVEYLIQGQVTFHTTMQMLYVEAGVGANGRRKGQPRTSKPLVRPDDIAVQRSEPWSTRERYVDEWKPGRGKSVRPNTRQQVKLMRRRLKYLAMAKHALELQTWLIAGFEQESDITIKL